jgi:hypothetical protein
VRPYDGQFVLFSLDFISASAAHVLGQLAETRVAPCSSATVCVVPARWLPVLAATLGLMLGVTACSDGKLDSSPPSAASDALPASPSNACPPAPRRLAAVLRKAVRRTGELQRLFALHSLAGFTDRDPDVRSGVYFVSGNIGAAV